MCEVDTQNKHSCISTARDLAHGSGWIADLCGRKQRTVIDRSKIFVQNGPVPSGSSIDLYLLLSG